MTYNAPLLITTVAVLFLPLACRRGGWRWWLPPLITIAVSVISVYVLFLPVTRQKMGITIFSDPTLAFEYAQFRLSLPTALQPIFGNRYLYFAGILVRNTLTSFAPRFWLCGGTHPWHQLSGSGHVQLVSLLLVDLGLLYLLGRVFVCFYCSLKKRYLGYLCAWPLLAGLLLLCCLIPSIITTDSPHATRSLEFFWVLMIIIRM